MAATVERKGSINLRGEKDSGRGSIVRDGLSTEDVGAVEVLVDADAIDGEANAGAVLAEERLVDEAKMLR